MQTFDITLKFWRDGVNAPFVRFDTAGGAHDSVEYAPLGGLGTHTELLHFLGADLDRVRCSGLTVSFPFGEFVSQLRVDDGMLVLYNRRRERHGTYPKTLYNDYLQFRQTIADRYQSQKIVIRKEQ